MSSEFAEQPSQTEIDSTPEVPKKKRMRVRKRLDPRKWALSQGIHNPLLYRSLKAIYADRSVHGLRRHQIKMLKKINDDQGEISRLGELRQRTKEERLMPVVAVQTIE